MDDMSLLPPAVQKESQNVLDTGAAILDWWSHGIQVPLFERSTIHLSILTFHPMFTASNNKSKPTMSETDE